MKHSSERVPDIVIWLLLSFLGASIVAATNIGMIWLESQTDPNDSARGNPFLFTLLNPAVLMFAAPIVFASTALAFGLIYVWLRDTVMWMSMACMYVFAITEVVIVGLFYDGWLAWPGSYLALLAAAALSKVVFKREARTSSSSGV